VRILLTTIIIPEAAVTAWLKSAQVRRTLKVILHILEFTLENVTMGKKLYKYFC
jgi:hypothetical protein